MKAILVPVEQHTSRLVVQTALVVARTFGSCIEGIAIRINALVRAERCLSPNLEWSLRVGIEPTRQPTGYWLLLREGGARKDHKSQTDS